MNTEKSKNSTLFRTLRYIRPYWFVVMVASVCGIIKLSLPMVLPQVLRYFTDDILSPASMLSTGEKLQEIYKWLIILALIYIFVLIPATYLRQRCSSYAGVKIMHTIRCQLYKHLQRMSASFYNKNKTGTVVSRIIKDVEMIFDFIWSVVTNIWIDASILIILLVLMCRINVLLTVISIIALPLSALTTKKIRVLIRKNSRKTQDEIAEISSYVSEKVSGYAVVKLFNNSEKEMSAFEAYSERIYKYMLKTNKLNSYGESFIGFFSEIITTIIVCLSAVMIVKDQMTIGELIIFYSYLGYFTTPLRRFAELNIVYAKCIAGIERVYEVLDMPPDILEREDAIEFSDEESVFIKFEDVSFKYDKEKGENNLEHISFEIKEGEKIALVGSSGCGKTTAVNLLTRFYDVDSGKIMIGSHDIRDYKLDSLYKQMGMVFQDTLLFSGTIQENLSYGCQDASSQQMEAAAKAANAYDFIMETPDQFQTILGEKGIGLSGGQKQRISIARVFLKNPRILILDEATSALDSQSEELVQEALDNLMKNRTSIVIAHRLSTIINVDKIIVMEKGEIIEVGTHQELLQQNGRYTELYNKQFKDIL